MHAKDLPLTYAVRHSLKVKKFPTKWDSGSYRIYFVGQMTGILG